MNGKFILIFFIVTNIILMAFSYAQYEVAPTSISKSEIAQQNIILSGLFNLDADSFNSSEQVQVNGSLESAVADLNKPQAGFAVGSSATGGLSFIDVVQLIFSVVSLLTPLPIIVFVYSMSMPVVFTVLFGVVSMMMYILALVEFFKGSSL